MEKQWLIFAWKESIPHKQNLLHKDTEKMEVSGGVTTGKNKRMVRAAPQINLEYEGTNLIKMGTPKRKRHLQNLSRTPWKAIQYPTVNMKLK